MDGLAAGGEVPTGRLPIPCKVRSGFTLLFYDTDSFVEEISSRSKQI